MAAIESILTNIGAEPSVNRTMNVEGFSMAFDFELYHSNGEKTEGDEIFIVPHGDFKEHSSAILYTPEELLEKLEELQY